MTTKIKQIKDCSGVVTRKKKDAYFKYKVRNQYGDVVTGKAEARTIEAAAAELSSRGLLVIDLQPLTGIPLPRSKV